MIEDLKGHRPRVRLLAEALQGVEPGVYVPLNMLAERSGLGVKTVRRALMEMTTYGWIECDARWMNRESQWRITLRESCPFRMTNAGQTVPAGHLVQVLTPTKSSPSSAHAQPAKQVRSGSRGGDDRRRDGRSRRV